MNAECAEKNAEAAEKDRNAKSTKNAERSFEVLISCMTPRPSPPSRSSRSCHPLSAHSVLFSASSAFSGCSEFKGISA